MFKTKRQHTMRSFLVAAAMVIVVSSAHATSSLSFEAEGYLLDMAVGDDSTPIVSRLSMTMPGSQQSTSLPMRLVKIEIFDTQRKVLLLTFQNPGDATLPGSFRLTVKDEVGTLKIGGKSRVGNFSWGM